MGPLEHRVYLALKDSADRIAALNSGDREWAKVIPGHVRNHILLADLEFEGTLDSCLRVLEANRLYRKIDEESGWVKMEAADYPGAK
jgi:hypothetical protein